MVTKICPIKSDILFWALIQPAGHKLLLNLVAILNFAHIFSPKGEHFSPSGKKNYGAKFKIATKFNRSLWPAGWIRAQNRMSNLIGHISVTIAAILSFLGALERWNCLLFIHYHLRSVYMRVEKLRVWGLRRYRDNSLFRSLWRNRLFF